MHGKIKLKQDKTGWMKGRNEDYTNENNTKWNYTNKKCKNEKRTNK